jgi:hypothetical protein
LDTAGFDATIGIRFGLSGFEHVDAAGPSPRLPSASAVVSSAIAYSTVVEFMPPNCMVSPVLMPSLKSNGARKEHR